MGKYLIIPRRHKANPNNLQKKKKEANEERRKEEQQPRYEVENYDIFY